MPPSIALPQARKLRSGCVEELGRNKSLRPALAGRLDHIDKVGVIASVGIREVDHASARLVQAPRHCQEEIFKQPPAQIHGARKLAGVRAGAIRPAWEDDNLVR